MNKFITVCAALAVCNMAGAQEAPNPRTDVTLTPSPSVTPGSVSPGTWTPVNDPGEGRELATVTLLKDGRVLVAGGEGYQGVLDLVELFDPTADTFLPAAPLQTQREQATATLLASGKVLVVGGTSDNVNAAPLASAELYDPVTNAWTYTGSLHQARFGHQATLLHDGRVLVMGGTPDVQTQLRTCEIWNPKTGKWTITGSMAAGRRYSSAVTLADGNVLEAGDDVQSELYSVSTGTWSSTGAQPQYIDSTTLAQLKDGTVLAPPSIVPGVAGPGLTYDPSTNVWSNTGTSTGRYYPSVTTLHDGTVLIAGGCTESCSLESVNSVVRYFPGQRAYANVAPMNYGRQNAVAVTLQDGRVLVQGGFGVQGPAEPEIYTQ